jgi:hypothetical protein
MISLIRFRRLPILCIGIAMALFIVLSSSPSVALIPQDLDSMSSQMTVLIGQEYRKDDLFNPGSIGLLIKLIILSDLEILKVLKSPLEDSIWLL